MKSGSDEFRKMGAGLYEREPINGTKTRSEKESLFAFDLPSLVERIKDSPTWRKGELNAMVLFESQDNTIILAALHEETELSSRQSGESLSLHVIEGELNFCCLEESVILNAGQMIVVHRRADYSLMTRNETVLLLNIAHEAPILTEN